MNVVLQPGVVAAEAVDANGGGVHLLTPDGVLEVTTHHISVGEARASSSSAVVADAGWVVVEPAPGKCPTEGPVCELSYGGNNQRECVKAMCKNCLHVNYRGAY